MMQKVISDEFYGRTMIVIAHRLEAVLDFDSVIVMRAGHIVEQGKPSDLLKVDSEFSRLYNDMRVTTEL